MIELTEVATDSLEPDADQGVDSDGTAYFGFGSSEITRWDGSLVQTHQTSGALATVQGEIGAGTVTQFGDGCYCPVDNRLYVQCGVSGGPSQVTMWDADDLSFVGCYDTPQGGSGLGYDPDLDKLLVVSFGSGDDRFWRFNRDGTGLETIPLSQGLGHRDRGSLVT